MAELVFFVFFFCFFFFFFIFFFQAEDGIRDRDVTGVQTCALPIYKRDEEANKMTMKPIYACWAGSAAMVMGAVVKVTVFADFYNAHSMYTPTA